MTISKDEAEFELEVQNRGLNAPRLTPEAIDAMIVGEKYFVDETFVICVLTLQNGHKVVGTSRPVSDANFREDLGRANARKKAREEIWELAGYGLRLQLQHAKEVDALIARGPR